MSGEVATMVQAQHAIPMISESNALIHMIERVARDPSVSLDRMERLIQMKEQMTARAARAAYDAAFAPMQESLPIIDERGEHGGTKSTYAKWDDINEAIKPVLAAHGFSIRFRSRQDGAKVFVTGVLSHRDGHSEETTIELPADNSGQKNAVQAIGSSMSYGQRYTAKLLLSLSSRKSEDDDGRSAGKGTTITDEQATTIRDLIAATKSNIEGFLKIAGVESIPDIPAAQYEPLRRMLEQKKAQKPKAQTEPAQ